MKTLRGRFFAAILGTVLLTVALSLAVGIKLTQDAAHDAAVKELAQRADLLAENAPETESDGSRSTAESRVRGEREGDHRPPPGAPPPPPGEPIPQRIVNYREAARILPRDALIELKAGRDVEGTTTLRGRGAGPDGSGRQVLYAARPLNNAVAVAARPKEVGFSDYEPYFKAFAISAAVAAVIAALVAALLARRLAAPLQKVAAASRELAAGRRPKPIVHRGRDEITTLTLAFDKMADQLTRARDAERSIFLAVSHELRTPLTAIRGYAEGVEDGTIDPATAAAVISREAGRLERLVQDLLAIARLDQGVLEVRNEPVNLLAVVKEAENRLRLVAEASAVEIKVQSAEEAYAVADYGRLLQVVTNLVENAIRAMPSGGSVKVELDSGSITVSDTGPGIPADDLADIFERFHRPAGAPRSSEGTGLGLAIVRELTEAMSGSVTVSSQLGRGTTFTVTLPA